MPQMAKSWETGVRNRNTTRGCLEAPKGAPWSKGHRAGKVKFLVKF